MTGRLEAPKTEAGRPTRNSAIEVFAAFLRLGLTSFGGPVAHLGYFRTEFVERRGWLGEAAYADLVSLCQFLPGGNIINLSVAIGLHFRGIAGAVAGICFYRGRR